MKIAIYPFLVFILFLIACKKDKKNQPETSPPIPVQIDSYPLKSGNKWEYYTESSMKISDSIKNRNIQTFWTVEKDTLIKGIFCYKIAKVDSGNDNSLYKSSAYYANKPEGFYGVASNSQSLLNLRLSNKREYGALLNLEYNSLDSITVLDTALVLLKFPSSINDSWSSYEYSSVFGVKRKYVGFATVVCSAGQFNCIKLMMYYDQDKNEIPDDGDPIIYQYISDHGLIKEELNFTSKNGDYFKRTSILTNINF